MQGRLGRWLATGVTAGAPLYFLMRQQVDANGKIVPAWRTFWDLFGASNQLLAALTLMGVTVWLWRTYRGWWVWLVTGIPTVWMYIMSMWALGRIIQLAAASTTDSGSKLLGLPTSNPVPWVASILMVLGGLMLLEAVIVLTRRTSPPPSPGLTAVPA
jgi:carbon starvation protein